MARFYNIEKSGIKTVIDEHQYEAIYKPKGWKISGIAAGEADVTPTSPTDETQIKNKARMRKASEKKNFDDDLIKGE